MSFPGPAKAGSDRAPDAATIGQDCEPASLPRLLYIGDVPVTDTVAGAALLFRLLRFYPAEKLSVICPMTPDMNRLPGVQYHSLDIALFPRLFRTRFAGLYSAWIAWRYHRIPRVVRRAAKAFRPEALLSISQTGGWAVAWRLALREHVPLHLMVHDDHVYAEYLSARFRRWAERHFAAAYRAARSRLCISPAMAETYEQRFGAPGQVIYPTRDPGNPVFASVAPRTLASKRALVFAYAGSIHGEACLRQVAEFARAAGMSGHRLLAYTPQHAQLKALAGANAGGLDVRAPLASAELLRRLREEADALLVTGSFEPGLRGSVSTLFPSKLADYSALGLPVIAWAPAYAFVTRFFGEHPGAAEVVTSTDTNDLLAGMERLATSSGRREQSGAAMIELGRRFFSPEAAWEVLRRALIDGRYDVSAQRTVAHEP